MEVKSNPALSCKSNFQLNSTFHQQIWIEVKEEISKLLHLEQSLYVAETCTLRKVKHKYQGGFEMWWWKRKNISWINSVRNEEE